MITKFDISQFVNVLTTQKVLNNVSKNFKLRRKRFKLSQAALAKHSGVSYGSIRRFETTGEISFSSLLKIASVLDCLSDFNKIPDPQPITDLKQYIYENSKTRKTHS